MRKDARGLRNNNPLNIIKTGSKWKGLAPVQNDLRFCQFKEMKYGWRAAFYLLVLVYYRNYNLQTVQDIISKWAPAEDGNNVEVYCSRINSITGIYPSMLLGNPYINTGLWLQVAYAMACVENGKHEIDAMPMLQGWQMLVHDRAVDFAAVDKECVDELLKPDMV